MSILSSIQGKIARVALSTHESGAEAINSYKPILHAFDPDVSFVMMVHSLKAQLKPALRTEMETAWAELQTAYQRPLTDNPILFVPSTPRELKRWIQDYFVVTAHNTGQPLALLKPYPDTPHYPYTHYTDEFAHFLGTYVKPVPLNFQGGNLLAIGDTLLIGRDTPPLGQESLLRATNLPKILPLGTDDPLVIDLSGKQSHQPFFHLDLYLTPGGHTPDGQPIVFLAEILDQYIHGTPPAAWPQVHQNLQTSLNHTALQLRQAGFVVARLPIIIHLVFNSFHVYSYNNIKVEAFRDHKRAYLPAYQTSRSSAPINQLFCQALTRTTAQLQAAGFTEIRTIGGNLLTLASQSRGGLHCLTKALARTP